MVRSIQYGFLPSPVGTRARAGMSVVHRSQTGPTPSPTPSEQLSPSSYLQDSPSQQLLQIEQILNIVLEECINKLDWLNTKTISRAYLILLGNQANLPPFVKHWASQRNKWRTRAGKVLKRACQTMDSDAALAAIASGAPATILLQSDLESIIMMLQLGIDVNVLDCHGYTLLHHLALTYNITSGVWEQLKSLGVDRFSSLINHRNIFCDTPLMQAGVANVVHLIDLGADISIRNPTNGNTFLHYLAPKLDAQSVDWASIKALPDLSSLINCRNKKGETPLLCARNEFTIAELASLGAKITDVDNNNNNILHLAMFDTNYQSRWNVSSHPVHSVAESTETALRALVNKKNKGGVTPLLLASNANYVKYLVKLGANVNATDNIGNTAFHLAALGGTAERCSPTQDSLILQILFNAGGPAILTKKNKAGKTGVNIGLARKRGTKPLKVIVNKIGTILVAAEKKTNKNKKKKKEVEEAKSKGRTSKRRGRTG
jgi:ankyrin repeat protein